MHGQERVVCTIPAPLEKAHQTGGALMLKVEGGGRDLRPFIYRSRQDAAVSVSPYPAPLSRTREMP